MCSSRSVRTPQSYATRLRHQPRIRGRPTRTRRDFRAPDSDHGLAADKLLSRDCIGPSAPLPPSSRHILPDGRGGVGEAHARHGRLGGWVDLSARVEGGISHPAFTCDRTSVANRSAVSSSKGDAISTMKLVTPISFHAIISSVIRSGVVT